VPLSPLQKRISELSSRAIEINDFDEFQRVASDLKIALREQVAYLSSIEDSAELEAKTSTTPRWSRRRARRRRKLAARVALALGLVLGSLAISDFVYHACVKAYCFPAEEITAGGIKASSPPVSGWCSDDVARMDELLQVDSEVVVLAAALVIMSTVLSRRIRKQRR
jgi:hypothetical protein